MLIENEQENKFYYKENQLIRCPYCNYKQFYVKNKILHKCYIKNEDYEIDENFIENNKNFLCDIKDIKDIENKCLKHGKEFLYYKDYNNFCEKCKEERTNLDNIIEIKEISEEEKNEFKEKIKKSEKIFEEVKKKIDNIVNEITNSSDNFKNKNDLIFKYINKLINYIDDKNLCKNYNLISTIKGI